MKQKRRKAVIDDGMNPELAEGADFDGFSGIPIIRKPEENYSGQYCSFHEKKQSEPF